MPNIVIFGATGGIGTELAKQYAKPDVSLYLLGRDKTRLSTLGCVCEQLGSVVKTFALDLRDRESLFTSVDDVLQEGTPDIAIFCAGVSSSVSVDHGKRLPEGQWELLRELEVNAVAQITAANYLAIKARRTRELKIVLISSLASLAGLSGSPGYSASKAALRVYGRAMRQLLKGTEVKFSVVLPGFVDTPMSRRFIGRKPLMISAEKAAQRIIAGIDKDKPEIYFPFMLYWGLRLVDLLPECMQDYFLKEYFFTVEPDSEARQVRLSDNSFQRGEVA